MKTLFDLFTKKETPVFRNFSRIPSLTYAVGDIHARADLFEIMIKRIKDDANILELFPRIILLGDYIDRGPDSFRVLDMIIELKEASWCNAHALLGNHEQSMLKFLEDHQYGKSWSRHGGAATLASYGISVPEEEAVDWDDISVKLNNALPQVHKDLLSSLPISYQAGDYFFVHAGVDPRKSILDQDVDTLLWIRSQFLSSDKSCEYVVVHGHTPCEKVEDKPWRIGIDTGAYASGLLSCVRLMGTSRDFIEVKAGQM
jgi:serine/threonine protein phosphatase 1